MLFEYHAQICQRALEDLFCTKALEIVIAANLGQDKIRGQIGHHEYHFDHNAFDESYAFIQAQRQIILDTLCNAVSVTPAWEAFGRLTHAAQDFYAHSNYIALWIASFPKGKLPPPGEVDALHPNFLNHPELVSGRIYFLDFVAFIPGMYEFAHKRVPQDSHTHMNLDHPGRGSLFPYALEAAVKRTQHEYQQIADQIRSKWGEAALNIFAGY